LIKDAAGEEQVQIGQHSLSVVAAAAAAALTGTAADLVTDGAGAEASRSSLHRSAIAAANWGVLLGPAAGEAPAATVLTLAVAAASDTVAAAPASAPSDAATTVAAANTSANANA
jgi:hypothetical protein